MEFALLAPAVFALLFGAYEMGWAMYCGATVRFAIERASRVLISNPATTAADIRRAAEPRLTGLPIDNLVISLDQESAGGAQVERVSWQYAYTMSLPYVPDATFRFDSSTVVPLPVS